MISPNLVLFVFATDFLRFFWVITPLDLVSVLYLMEKSLRGRLPKTVTSVAAGHLFVFFPIVSISGMLNSLYAIDHIVLLVGTFLAVAKAVVFIDALLAKGNDAWKPLTLGFLALNVLLFLSMLAGIGFSGSGRFSGFFPQTNGMAAFQTVAIATALFVSLQKKSMIALFTLFLSFALLLLSGSRGSLLSATFMLVLVLFHWLRRSKLMVKALVYPMGLTVLVLVTMALDPLLLAVSELFSQSKFSGVQRIGMFLTAFQAGELNDMYTQSRGMLNEAAMEHFLQNPTLFGHGYESSRPLLGLGNRVHNIFLSSALELGGLGFLFFLFAFISTGFMAIRRFTSSGITFLFVLLSIAVWFQAFKTPYYFLNGVSWAVMIFAFISNNRGFGTNFQNQTIHA